MNRLPPRKKPGDPVLAADWNALLEAVASRTPRPGPGLELVAASGGFFYSAPAGPRAVRQSLPPFAVIAIEKDDDVFQVIVKEGRVIERLPKTGGGAVVKFHMPKAGGVALDAVPRPKIAMSPGDTLSCKIATDATGAITGEPELIVSAQDEDGTHYQPEDPQGGGVDGEVTVKLLKLEDDGGVPKVTVYQQSDIEHWAQLWTGRNVGGGAGVFKRHREDENIYEFRKVRGDYGVVEKEDEDEVALDLWLENVGHNGAPVWVEPTDGGGDPPDGPAKFRVIGPRSSQPQIQVKCDPDPQTGVRPDRITVEGNGYDATESDVRKFTLSIRDGLVTSFLKLADNGWWGDITIQFQDHNSGGSGDLKMFFEDGLLTDVQIYPGSNSWVNLTGAGTEDDRGVAVIYTRDTDTF